MCRRSSRTRIPGRRQSGFWATRFHGGVDTAGSATEEEELKGMHQSDAVQRHLRQLTIICFAILSGVILFSAVVWYLLNNGSLPPEDLDLPPWMGTLFNVVALVALGKAYLLPRLLPAPGPGASDQEVLGWHKRTTVLGFALREGGAFVALVGAMLTGRLAGTAAVVGLAVLTMVLAWPRQEQLRPGRSA